MRRSLQLLLGSSGLALAWSCHAQVVTINQSFTGTTAAGWVFGGTGYTPVLTAAQGIDPSGSGWLRMTDTGTNEATYAYDPTPFASANATITAQFNYASYGGSGADGITFFLADASVPFSVGAYGGSLGYAQKTAAGGATNINGMAGGYLGLGIDEFGNYSNPSEGRVGGPGFLPGEVAVRGPGSGLTGYNYLGGTTGGFSQPIDYPNQSSRPTGSQAETFQIVLTSTNQLSVSVEFGNSGTFNQIFTASLSGYTRPSDLIMGFTAGSGSDTDVHEIQNVVLSSISANIWTNGTASSTWATANNWYGNPAVVPTIGSDVLLNNNQVSTAQTINVTGDQIIRSLQIDAPFSYTLNGTGTLEFNNEGVAGPTGIIVTNSNGTANHEIDTAMQFDNPSWVENNSTGNLTLTGTMATTSGNSVSFNGSGNVSASGVISGAGSIIQNGSGTTTFSGANTYTGGTTVSSGTLNANNNTALGTGTVTLSGGTLGSTSSGTVVNNAITLAGNATVSGITTSGAMTQSGGSYTLDMANATQSGTVALSNSGTAHTLTVEVDSGNTGTISGIISNGSTSTGDGLTKTGGGTLDLNARNTYTGTTTVSGGTLSLGVSNALTSTSTSLLNLQNNATLALNRNSQATGALTFTNGGTIDYGAGTANTSLYVTSINSASTGVLTIDNWDTTAAKSTELATSTSTTAAAILNDVYFAGVGSGAAYQGASSVSLYGGGTGWLITPNTTFVVWDGAAYSTSSVWQEKTGPTTNWVGNGRPSQTSGSTQKIEFAGTVGTGPKMDSNYWVNAVMFSTSATASFSVNEAGYALTMDGNVPSIIQQSGSAQTISSGTLTWGSTGQTNVNGVIDVSGAGSLTISSAMTSSSSSDSITKLSSGTVIFSGSNSGYKGTWDIEAGTVEASGANASTLGTGAITVASGATLETAGGAAIANAVTVGGAGYNNQGAILSTATATISGAVSFTTDTTIASTSGTLTFSSTSTFGGTGNITVAGAGNVTFTNGIDTTSGGFTQNGTGTTTFDGVNTYTGDTTVNSGTLNLNASGNAFTGDLAVNASAAGAGTVNDNASGELSGTAAVSLGSYTTSTGTTGGTFKLNGHTETIASVAGASGTTLALGSGGTLNLNGTATTTFAGTITGTSATLNKENTGSFWISGNNSGLTGSVNVSNGVLGVQNSSSALGSAAVSVTSAGNFEVEGGLTLANNFTVSSTGASTGNGAIENISGNNTISGSVTATSASQIQSDSGTLTLSGGMALSGNNMTLATNSSVGTAGAITISGAITGTSASTMTISGPGTVTLSGSNTGYSGSYTLSNGTLQANNAAALNKNNNITFAAGSVLALGASETTNAINGAGTINFGTSNTLTIGGNATAGAPVSMTLSGAFSGTGVLVIGPNVTLTLGANFSDSGLEIKLAGGTLMLNGTNDTFGSLDVSANSTIDFASGVSSDVVFGTVTDESSAKLTVANWTDASDYFYATNQPTSESWITFNGYTGATVTWQNYNSGPDSNHQITPAPEPAAYGALMIGALASGVLVLRRRKARAAA